MTVCVHFNEPSISGTELLDRAGVSYLAQSSGIGAAVCKLDGEGCDYPAEDCFCHCKGADCAYWAYQHLRAGTWVYSQLGAAASTIRPGDVDGWAWGKGSLQAGAQPPLLTFEQVCAAVALPPPTAAPPPPTTAQSPPTVAPPTEVPALPTQAPPPTRAPAATATHAARPQPTAIAAAQPTATAPATEVPATKTPQAAGAPAETAMQQATEAIAPTQAPAETSRPTGAVVPTPAAGLAQDRPAPTSNYLAFGALALLLCGGIVVVLLRRRRQ